MPVPKRRPGSNNKTVYRILREAALLQGQSLRPAHDRPPQVRAANRVVTGPNPLCQTDLQDGYVAGEDQLSTASRGECDSLAHCAAAVPENRESVLPVSFIDIGKNLAQLGYPAFCRINLSMNKLWTCRHRLPATLNNRWSR